MTNEEPKRLTLELDSDSEPIGGRMTEEGGESRRFVGWLGLAAALGRVLGHSSDQKTADSSAPSDRSD